jgi:hypothetical protein
VEPNDHCFIDPVSSFETCVTSSAYDVGFAFAGFALPALPLPACLCLIGIV